MAAVTVEALLGEVSADAPCGTNLEFDPDYLEMMRVSQGTPERQMGATVVPAEEPNWRDVKDRCLGLCRKTKDLAVILKLSEAMLRTDGLAGLRTCLGAISGLLEQRWETVHPQLDPSDGNDPTMRLNLINSLTDPSQFLARIRAVPLTNSIAGKFGLRELAWATGRAAPPAGVEPPKPEVVEAAFKDTPQDELKASAQAADDAIELVKAADGRLNSLLGAGQGVNFEPLLKTLREVGVEIRQRLPAEAGAAGAGAVTGPGGQAAAGSGGRMGTGDIQSPDDVKAAIDRICQYYERAEPSSPIPLFLRRAQKLVGKSFLEIMKNMTPDAVKQVEMLGGIEEAT